MNRMKTPRVLQQSDHNRSRTVVVAASFLVQATMVGVIFSFSVFFDALQAEFGWSRAVISGAASSTSLVMGLTGMIYGRLNDRLGPRVLVSWAAVLFSAGYLLMSRVSAPWQLYLSYAGLVGVAFGAHDVVTLSTVARWFRSRRGQMSGIVKTGAAAGQVVTPAVIAFLIARFGWRGTFIWIAALTGPLVMLFAQYLRVPPPSAEQRAAAASVDHARNIAEAGRTAMRSATFRRICIAQLCLAFSMLTIIVHVVPYATDLGVSRQVAASVLSTIGAVSIIGRLSVGTLLDRIGARRSLQICYAMMLSSFVILQFAFTPLVLYLFALVYGVAHGGVFTSMSPLVAECFGTAAHGRLFGTVVFIGTMGGAMGPIIAGHSFDVLATYRPAFLLMILLVSVALVAISRVSSCRS